MTDEGTREVQLLTSAFFAGRHMGATSPKENASPNGVMGDPSDPMT